MSQTVWTVTSPNGIPGAIANASPGDILQLSNIFYEPFVLDRGLIIRGNGATIGAGPNGALYTVSIAVPAGQVAYFDRVSFTYGYSPFGSTGCSVSVTGTARFEQCNFLTTTGSEALSASNANVTLSGCSIVSAGTTSTGVAMRATTSLVELRDCLVTGSGAGCHPIAGCSWSFGATPALQAQDCRLHFERTTFVGGANNISGLSGDGAPAILATNCRMWIAGGVVRGGGSIGGSGGHGLSNFGPHVAALQSVTLAGGVPGGNAATGPINPTASLTRLTLQPAWTRGMNSTFGVAGDANAPFLLLLATDTTATTTPIVAEPVWVVTSVVVAASMLDQAGNGTLAVAVPNLPTLLHTPVWCQAVSGTALPLNASTLAGGLVR